MRRLTLWAACLAAGAATMLAMAGPVRAGEVLITDEEAKLPPPKGAFSVASRGITRGPRIALVPAAEPAHSPLHLQIKFESFGGAKIDPDSVKVTYLKTPAVDLTARVKPFVQPTGIDMPDASVPAGDHTVRIDVKDSDGRAASASFTLKVAP